MTEPGIRVCSRCGEAAADRCSCSDCGLNLAAQSRVPTRVRWDPLRAGDPKRSEPERLADSPRLRAVEATPARGEPGCPGKAGWVARAVGRDLALLAAAAAVLVLVSCGTSNTEASKVAAALNSASLNFSELTSDQDVSCRPAGRRGHLAAFACTWEISGGSAQHGTWTIARGGLERISQGGDGTTPPSDAAQATAIVNSVVESRGASGSEDCTRDGPFVTIQGQRVSVGNNTFLCLLVGSDGTPLVADGQPAVEKWAWNPDGTVGSDTLDTDPTDETAAVAGITAAASSSSSSGNASGNTSESTTTSQRVPSSCAVPTILYETEVPPVPVGAILYGSGAHAHCKAFLNALQQAGDWSSTPSVMVPLNDMTPTEQGDQHVDCQLVSGDGTAHIVVEDQGQLPSERAVTLSAAHTTCADLEAGGWVEGAGQLPPPGTGLPTPTVSTTATQPNSASGKPACAAPADVVAFSVSGTTCATAIGLVHALLKSDVCAVGDSYGNAASSTCQIDGFDCSASLGYPPGQTVGEESAVLACTEESDSHAHVRFIEPV